MRAGGSGGGGGYWGGGKRGTLGLFPSLCLDFFAAFLKEVPRGAACARRPLSLLPAPCPKRGGLGVFWGFNVFPPFFSPVIWRGAGGDAGVGDAGAWGRGYVPQTPASPVGPDPGSGSQEQPGERVHPCGTVSRESGGPSGGPAVQAARANAARGAMAAPPTHATSLAGALWPRSCFSLSQAGLNTTTPKSPGRLRAPEAGVASRCSPTSPSSLATPGSPLHPAPDCIQPWLPRGCWGAGGEGRSEGASCSAGSR